MKFMKNPKRKAAFFLAFTVMFTAMPESISGLLQVRAADPIATLSTATADFN